MVAIATDELIVRMIKNEWDESEEGDIAVVELLRQRGSNLWINTT
jgi:hypothetical protein